MIYLYMFVISKYIGIKTQTTVISMIHRAVIFLTPNKYTVFVTNFRYTYVLLLLWTRRFQTLLPGRLTHRQHSTLIF